jgi:hypothetical protein
MANLIEVYDIRYGNTNLRKKTTAAVAEAAFDILNETSATEYHTERVDWAQKALSNTPQEADKLMWAISQNSTINANPTSASDNDIKFVVNSTINSIAINM